MPRPITTEVTYEQPQAADAARLSRFAIDAFIATYGQALGPAWARRWASEGLGMPSLEKKLDDPRRWWRIAQCGNEIVGYAELRPGKAPEFVDATGSMELGRLYVDPRWFGRGVGEALMAACHEQALSRGLGSMWLRVWAENTRAIAFYRRHGFGEAGWDTFDTDHGPAKSLYLQRHLPGHPAKAT
ncbi:GNAT family N-acetyltransferase [Ramlibacter humi]|nr:GNAT family N-acetyltransferase [Ramlibacter humi]